MDPDAPPSVHSGPWGLDGTNFLFPVPAAPCPGVASGVRVNLGEQGS